MKKTREKLFSWACIAVILAFIAVFTSLLITKRTVWITLKRNKREEQ